MGGTDPVSSLKIEAYPASRCLVVDNFLLLKFSLGIFNFFICVTEQVLFVDNCDEIFQNIFSTNG